MLLWKVKGDTNDSNTYQGIPLLKQLVDDVLQRVLEVRLRCKVEENIGME